MSRREKRQAKFERHKADQQEARAEEVEKAENPKGRWNFNNRTKKYEPKP